MASSLSPPSQSGRDREPSAGTRRRRPSVPARSGGLPHQAVGRDTRWPPFPASWSTGFHPTRGAPNPSGGEPAAQRDGAAAVRPAAMLLHSAPSSSCTDCSVSPTPTDLAAGLPKGKQHISFHFGSLDSTGVHDLASILLRPAPQPGAPACC
jgi:hypothetical protein